MSWSRFRAVLVSREPVAQDQWLLTLESTVPLGVALAGQFVQLALPGAFWPRPFSLESWDSVSGATRFRLLVARAGAATAALTALPEGTTLEGHGPLGRPFPQLPGPVWMLAGGYGVAPLRLAARGLAGPGRLFYGARSRALLWEAPEPANSTLTCCTEDGSLGERGNLIEVVSRELDRSGLVPALFACGPMSLLAATARLGRERGLATHLAVEISMPCGIGVCRGCALPLAPELASPERKFAMACEDGPVFEGGSLDWELEAACRV